MQKLDTAKKVAILTSAKQRFRTYGVQKTTMQEIARDAGIAVGTLYLYFKNKEEIILSCAEAFAQRHVEAAETILRSPISPVEKLRSYILNRFRAAQETRISSAHAAEIIRIALRLKPETLVEETTWRQKTIFSILQEGIASNDFQIANPARDAEVFLYAISCFLSIAVIEGYREPEESQLCLVMDWFIEQWSRQ